MIEASNSDLKNAMARLPAILLTMLLELLGATVINAYFEGLLKEFRLLSAVLPVISAISGNVGL